MFAEAPRNLKNVSYHSPNFKNRYIRGSAAEMNCNAGPAAELEIDHGNNYECFCKDPRAMHKIPRDIAKTLRIIHNQFRTIPKHFRTIPSKKKSMHKKFKTIAKRPKTTQKRYRNIYEGQDCS